MEISETIRRIRVMYDLTQEQFAKIAGASNRSVSSWERGTKLPRMGAIQKIADYFGLKKSDIIDGTVQFDNIRKVEQPQKKEKDGDILDLIFDDQPAVLKAIRSIKADDGLVIDDANKKFIQRAILLALREAKEKGIDHVKIDL